MKTRIGVSLCALAAGLCLLAAVMPINAKPSTRPGKLLVRPKFVPGRVMRYNLKLAGSSAWAPREKGFHWGKMDTDFTFDLATKVIRERGLCTFNLAGQHLKSTASGPKGSLGIVADRRKVRLKIGDAWQAPSNKTPLVKPMTLTQGPLGGVRFTTGAVPIAIYLIPHVDRRFWGVLTAAPLGKVAPGDEWDEEFKWRLPDSRGNPMDLTGRWKVLGYQTHRGRKVLAFALAVTMDLKNTEVMLRNGDMAYIHSGSYSAKGKAMWDLSRGVLCYATADQKIAIRAEKPKLRAFRSQHKCTLDLISFRENTNR